jgi:TetR/AcrR family fatty acid metabolism transcriptional regulator
MKNPSRTQRYKDLKRSEILGAAETVFASKGFARSTMEEIARKAEFATGTIYLYFRNKEQLYITLLESKARGYLDYVGGRLDKAKRREERLMILVRASLDYVSLHSGFFKIFFAERDRLEWRVKDAVRERIVRTHQAIIELFGDVIADAMRARLIKRCSPRKVATALMGLMNAVVREWLLSESNVRVAGLERFVLDVFLHGVGNRKGNDR